MHKTDRLERIHDVVNGIREKKIPEIEKSKKIEKFFDRYFLQYKNQINFLMGGMIDDNFKTAHDAQHKAIQYFSSYNWISGDNSDVQEKFTPLNILGKKIGLVHSDTITSSMIQKYTNEIMFILWDLGRNIDRENMELAFYDTLTGISNRAGLIRSANAMCHEDELVSVVWLDLDYFKKINDELWHDAGDEALKFFAKRLSDFMKYKYWEVWKNTWNVPFYGRYWWEEFLIVLPWLDSTEAMSVAREFVAWIRKESITLVNSKNHKKIIKTINISAWVATHDPKKPYKRALNSYIKSKKSWWPSFPLFLWLIMQHADVALMLSKIYGRDRATHFWEEVSIPDNIRKWQEFKKKLEDRLRWVDDIDEISKITNALLEELEIKISI